MRPCPRKTRAFCGALRWSSDWRSAACPRVLARGPAGSQKCHSDPRRDNKCFSVCFARISNRALSFDGLRGGRMIRRDFFTRIAGRAGALALAASSGERRNATLPVSRGQTNAIAFRSPPGAFIIIFKPRARRISPCPGICSPCSTSRR